MSITSFPFFFFVCAVLLAYFLVPKRFQWIVLLAASCAFYLSYGAKYILYVLFTSTSVFLAANGMQKITDEQRAFLKGEGKALGKEEKNACKAKNKQRKKRLMLCALLANIFLLCLFKYAHFALEQLNALLGLVGAGLIEDRLRLIAPLGISFYTFQMVGYLLDVYWGNVEAEKNWFRTLLFCSFFPQMTQGPISEFGTLSAELFAEHDFSYRNYSWGMQRMAWGFFKKLVIADRIAVVVNAIYGDHAKYGGLYVFIGAACFAIQLYADFSGCMDVVLGASHLLGIEMPENFNSPFLAHTIREYWQRWHITLGGWLRDYLFYPMLRTSVFVKIGDGAKKLFGKKKGKKVPTYLGLIILWAAVGYWHGGLMKYVIGTGLLHCFYIILGELVEPVSVKLRKALHSEKLPYKIFQTARTFFLICLGHIFFRANNVPDAVMMYKSIFQPFSMSKETLALLGLDTGNLIVLLVSFAVLVAVDIYKYREKQEEEPRLVLKSIASKPVIVSWAVFMVLAVAVLIFGMYGLGYDSGAFIYARI